jgi:heat shock protein HslJ
MKHLLALLSIVAVFSCCKSKEQLPMNQEFRLVELQSKPVPASIKATLKFQAANMGFSGNNSCNNYFGTYELKGSALQFGPAGSTKKYCATTADWETPFMQMLGMVDNYAYTDGQLRLQSGKQVLAVFN